MLEVTNRAWMAETHPWDDHLAPDGRVMEMLSEHQCQGWLEGYLLTGRHGFFSCYEAFIHIIDAMFNQHAKWLKVCNEIPWRRPIASLNYLLSSHVWRQDHNGFSHQDPGFIDHVVNKKAEVVRVYLPPDANCLLSVTDHCLRSRNYVNVVVAGKQPAPQWLTMDEAIKHCTAGLGIWEWASNDRGGEPDVVMACCGDVPTLETLAAVDLLRRHAPDLKVRVVNVVNLMKLQPASEHPHGLSDQDFDALFTTDKPIVFAFHGYPWLIHRLTYRRHGHRNLHVRGYKEEGTTTHAVRHVRAERSRPLPPGQRRDRPRAEARGARRVRQAGDPRQAHGAQGVHRPVRRRHARDHRLEVGAAGGCARPRAFDGGRQCMRSELLGTLRRRDAGGRRDTYSAHQADMNISPGRCFPLGATLVEGGVNFCVFSSQASRLELLLFDSAGDAEPARVIRLDAPAHRTYHYWHAFVPGLRAGQVYAYRAVGPFDPARGFASIPRRSSSIPMGAPSSCPTGTTASRRAGPGDNTKVAMRSVVVDPDAYDWEGDAPLRRPFATTVIYEMHVAGLHAASELGRRARYARHVRRHDREDSLSARSRDHRRRAAARVPVRSRRTAPPGLVNYWGYSPVSFFAPHAGYSSRRDPLGPVDEFRDLVKALHRAGIEVILDVVYNHTAEGNHDGPTLSFRGLDNETYYLLEADRARYADYTGTGNTLNANDAVVRRLIRRQPAVLGRPHARRRLPVRPGVRAVARRVGPPAPAPARPVGHRVGSGPGRDQADRRGLGRRRALPGRAASPATPGRSGTASSATTSVGS